MFINHLFTSLKYTTNKKLVVYFNKTNSGYMYASIVKNIASTSLMYRNS